MKLWLLRPALLPEGNDPWEPWYDKAFGFVIRAETEGEARELAHDNAGDENLEGIITPWLDKKYSTCIELTEEGEIGMVLRDFARA